MSENLPEVKGCTCAAFDIYKGPSNIVRHGMSHETSFFLFTGISLSLLSYYVRSFATGNQDRIIRTEENSRSFRLTGKPLDSRLTRNQIIALKFAEDEEYVELAQRTVDQDLSARDIKAAMHKWKADHHRI